MEVYANASEGPVALVNTGFKSDETAYAPFAVSETIKLNAKVTLAIERAFVEGKKPGQSMVRSFTTSTRC